VAATTELRYAPVHANLVRSMEVYDLHMRPRFSIFIATSLDGYIARANGAIDWLSIVHPVDEAHGYGTFMSSVDAIVIGRGTYETVLEYDKWPYVGKSVIVMTHRPAKAQNAEEFYSGPVQELASRLTDAKRVYVDGGKVVSQFFAAGLIDDITISVIPIVLGDGIRLFSGAEGEHRLDLESSRSWPNGMVQMRYLVRKDPGPGVH
jgi:dihydrofolate reductase